MRLLFNRCHGENPISPAPAESGEPCEFVELEFFIDGPCESCTSTAQQGWIVVFHHLAVWFWAANHWNMKPPVIFPLAALPLHVTSSRIPLSVSSVLCGLPAVLKSTARPRCALKLNNEIIQRADFRGQRRPSRLRSRAAVHRAATNASCVPARQYHAKPCPHARFAMSRCALEDASKCL